MFISTEHWNWDVWKREDQEEYNKQDIDTTGPHCEDEDFVVSCKTKFTLFCKGGGDFFQLRQVLK